MKALPTIVRDHWFVAAQSKAITTRPQRVMFLGSPLMLLRNLDGCVWALEDRCPHRGVALSTGRLQSHGIVCPYHGWAFDADGECTAMPGARDAKPYGAVSVPRFFARERDGLVWVAKNEVRELPDRVLILDSAKRRFSWQALWQTPVIEAQENFLDALHTHSIHRHLVRGGEQRHPTEVEIRSSGDGFCVDYRGQPTQSGWLYRLFESKRISERAYFSALSVAQLEYRYAAGWTAWITLYFTPESERSTHVFGTLHVDGRVAPPWLVKTLVWPLVKRVARQDQAIVEHLRNNSDYFSERHPVITPMDIVRPFLESAWFGRDPPSSTPIRRTLYL